MIKFQARKLRCWVGKVEGYDDYNSNQETPIMEFASTELLEEWIRNTLGWSREEYDDKGNPLTIDHDSVIWWSCIGFIR